MTGSVFENSWDLKKPEEKKPAVRQNHRRPFNLNIND